MRVRTFLLLLLFLLGAFTRCSDSEDSSTQSVLNWIDEGSESDVRRVLVHFEDPFQIETFESSCATAHASERRSCLLGAWTHAFQERMRGLIAAVPESTDPVWHWSFHSLGLTARPSLMRVLLPFLKYEKLSARALQPSAAVSVSHWPSFGFALLSDVPPSQGTPALTCNTSGVDASKLPCAALGCSKGWLKGATGQGLRVAVVDTGIHPWLLTAKEPVWIKRLIDLQTESPQHLATFARKQLLQQKQTIDADNTSSDRSHGTAVTSLIAEVKFGAAFDAEVIPLSACCSAFDVLNEEKTLTALENALLMNADVVNLSMGWDYQAHDTADAWARILALSEKLGTLLVAAVGNDGLTSTHSVKIPAALASSALIGVGSVDWHDDTQGNTQGHTWVRSPFSSYGLTRPDFTAPGCRVSASTDGRRRLYFTGTSISAPLVSAAYLQLRQLFSEKTPSEVLQLMRETATSKGALLDGVGYGVPQVDQALTRLEH